jgi:predicted alpha/beta superfamily hydrolase
MLATLVLALAAVAPAAAQVSAPDAAAVERYPVPGSEVLRVEAPGLGRAYEIVVVLPFGYADDPERRYPVLYFTDMPQSIQLIAGMHRRLRAGGRGLEDAILVGLGYAVGDTGEYSRRRDYTPSPHGDVDAVSDMPGRAVSYGEAEAYRRFLAETLFPRLEARYRMDPARRIYLGHSYGGLFGTHVLLTAPRMFSRYVLVSPSLWYGRRLMIARERGFAMQHKDLPAEAYFMIGGEETVAVPDILPTADARNAMVEDMDEMVRMLRSRAYPSLRVTSRVFPGEDHGSVYVPAVRAGLEWALPGTERVGLDPCVDRSGAAVPLCSGQAAAR